MQLHDYCKREIKARVIATNACVTEKDAAGFRCGGFAFYDAINMQKPAANLRATGTNIECADRKQKTGTCHELVADSHLTHTGTADRAVCEISAGHCVMSDDGQCFRILLLRIFSQNNWMGVHTGLKDRKGKSTFVVKIMPQQKTL